MFEVFFGKVEGVAWVGEGAGDFFEEVEGGVSAVESFGFAEFVPATEEAAAAWAAWASAAWASSDGAAWVEASEAERCLQLTDYRIAIAAHEEK